MNGVDIGSSIADELESAWMLNNIIEWVPGALLELDLLANDRAISDRP